MYVCMLTCYKLRGALLALAFFSFELVDTFEHALFIPGPALFAHPSL